MTEKEELLAWAALNRPVLLGRTANEVAYLARLNDFSAPIVYDVFSHWSPVSGLDTRFREAMGVGKELYYLDSRDDPFKEQWHALGLYLLEGREWTL